MNQDILYINASNIHWFQKNQADERANSFGKPLESFPPSFAQTGWDVAQGVVFGYKLNKTQQKDAITERQAWLAELRERNNEYKLAIIRTRDDKGEDVMEDIIVSSEDLAAYAEKLWTDDKGGWIKPEYGGNCCYRRGYALPASLMAYGRLHDGQTFQVPIVERNYGSEHEMHLDRLRENSQVGRKGYNLLDQFVNTYKLVKEGYSEADVQKWLGLKRGAAQKLYAAAMLHRKFPKVQLLERSLMAHPVDKEGKQIDYPAYAKGGYVPFSRMKAGALRSLLGLAKKPDSIDDVAAEAMGHRDPVKKATEEQVEKFIELLHRKQTNASAIMDKSSISTLANSCPGTAPIVQKVLNAILANDGAAIGRAIDEESAKA